jgi:hypothetical protein
MSGWISGSLLLLYTLVYGCTIGPVTYALVSELSSTRTKSKTINIARMGYNAFGVFNCVVTPYQLNPTALNWGGKTAWFWVVFCAVCFVYAFFRIPEPRGRTYAEMDWLFAEGVSARKFASTVVPRFGEERGASGTSSPSTGSGFEKKVGDVSDRTPSTGSLGSGTVAVATVESVDDGRDAGARRSKEEGEGAKRAWRLRFWAKK